MRRINLILGIGLLVLALSAPASGERRRRVHGSDAEGVGVVIEATRDALTLVGGIQLELSYRTIFVNEQGEEIPRARVLGAFEGSRKRRGRSRSRATTSVGLGVVEYEGRRDGKRIHATRVTPLFENELQ